MQTVAKAIPTYFNNLFDLKKELVDLDIPPNTFLFTADATSMYTNICTDAALQEIWDYINGIKLNYPDISHKALISALTLIMKFNIFKFGDSYWLQKQGTAMDAPPARTYATVFQGIKDILILVTFAENFLLLCRFIDGILGLWIISDPSTDYN
eukprot:4565219-Ditylum_brightwellii.AAC.1